MERKSKTDLEATGIGGGKADEEREKQEKD